MFLISQLYSQFPACPSSSSLTVSADYMVNAGKGTVNVCISGGGQGIVLQGEGLDFIIEALSKIKEDMILFPPTEGTPTNS